MVYFNLTNVTKWSQFESKCITISGYVLKCSLFTPPLLPGLGDILWFPSAVDHVHISCADLRSTNGHEIWSWAANGELGKVGQWLADSCSKQERTHDLVECSHILVEVRVGVNPLAVNQVSLSRGNLRRMKTDYWESFSLVFLNFPKGN